MRCPYCHERVKRSSQVCEHCGHHLAVQEQTRSMGHVAFILGILALSIPVFGAIIGMIGLPFACVGKRKSAMIMNSIAIAVWGLVYTAGVCILALLV